MRVVFDTQIFSAQEFGGISRYFASLARCMNEQTDVEAQIVAPLHINDYLSRLPPDLYYGRRVRQWANSALIRRAASMVLSAPHTLARRPDIVHETYYSPFKLPSLGASHVVTVYDMIHERFPDNFSAKDPIRHWKRKAVMRADHVICISHQTRHDLLTACDLPEERVSVTHLGYDPLAALVSVQKGDVFRSGVFGEDIPYLLFVGSRGGYKNFDGLLQAYAASSALKEQFRLLCFGGGPFTAQEQSAIAKAGVASKVHQIGGSDAALANCYRHAALFLYPSLYEGFGIPPLEAMSLDCPVACSNTSSIPEVVGDAATMFDPTDTGAIRESIEAVLGSGVVRDELIRRGRLRCECFSWQRCAQETIGIYRAIRGEGV